MDAVVQAAEVLIEKPFAAIAQGTETPPSFPGTGASAYSLVPKAAPTSTVTVIGGR